MKRDFGGEAAAYYHRYRHGYPSAVIDALAGAFKLTGQDVTVDLGCGTGQLSLSIARQVRAVVRGVHHRRRLRREPRPRGVGRRRLLSNGRPDTGCQPAARFRRAGAGGSSPARSLRRARPRRDSDRHPISAGQFCASQKAMDRERSAGRPLCQGLNSFQCPSETTSTVPSTTFTAVSSSMAYVGTGSRPAHFSAFATS